jgi:hypothetical protein
MVLYGHRDGYGGPFENLSKIKAGDSVYAQARNGGPIVRYVVDRVERQATLSSLTFDKTDLISYAVLVTSERGVFDNNQLIVVARALPVTDAAPTVPDLSAGVDTEAPFGLESLLGVASAVAAVLCFRYLNGRTRDGVRVLATAPIAVFAAIQLMLLLDAILPLTR